MRIHIDKYIANPRGVFAPGEICDVDDKTALELIEAGYATHISIWLRAVAAENGYDLVKAKQPNRKTLTKMLDF